MAQQDNETKINWMKKQFVTDAKQDIEDAKKDSHVTS